MTSFMSRTLCKDGLLPGFQEMGQKRKLAQYWAKLMESGGFQ